MILVTGAAGKTGRAIIRALAETDLPVRALVFREEQRNIVESHGANEVVIGDMREEDVLLHAAEGVNKLYHICPNVSPHEVEIGRNVIFAAQAAIVDQFVYHSVLHPQTQKMLHHWSKLRVEELLLESNLPFTILQPTIYMQNILSSWGEIVASGVYTVPYSVERKLSMVDLEDVAKVAALVLTEPGHVGATYELCGVSLMSAEKIVEILSEKLGREIRAEEKSIEVWVQGAKESGLGEYQIDTLAKMFHYYDAYGLPGNGRILRSLLSREPTDFIEFIDRLIQDKGRIL